MPVSPHTRTDKVFAVVITLALVGALVGAAIKSFNFWHNMATEFDPAATWPLIWGVLFSLLLGGVVVGIFLYGRSKEIRDEK